MGVDLRESGTRVAAPPASEGPPCIRKSAVRLPGKENSNSHGARPVHHIITMTKWIWTSRLAIKNSLSPTRRTTSISSGRVLNIHTRAQQKLLHSWIILVIVKPHLVQIGRVDGPTEYCRRREGPPRNPLPAGLASRFRAKRERLETF